MTTRRRSAPGVRSAASRWIRRGLFVAGGLTLAGAVGLALAPAASATDAPPPAGPASSLLGGVGDLVGAVVQPLAEHVIAPVLTPPATPSVPAPPPAPAPAVPPPAPAAPAAPPVAVEPAATAPGLGTALGAITTPLGRDVVDPVVSAAQPLVTALADTVVAPVAAATRPLAPVLAPITSGVVAPVADGVLGPVLGALDGTPVGDLLSPVVSVVGSVLDPVAPGLPGSPAVPSGPRLPGSSGATPGTGPAVLPPGSGPVRGDALLPAPDAGAATATGRYGSDRRTTTTQHAGAAASSSGADRSGAPVGGGDRPVPPTPGAPAGSGATGSPLRVPAGSDVLAVLTAAAVLLGGSRLLAVARGRVELPLRSHEVPVSPA